MGNVFTPAAAQIYKFKGQERPDEVKTAARLRDTRTALDGVLANNINISSAISSWASGNVTRPDVNVNYQHIFFSPQTASPDQSGRINALLQVAPGYAEHKATLESAIKAYSSGGEFSIDKVSQKLPPTKPVQSLGYLDSFRRIQQQNSPPEAQPDFTSVYKQGLDTLTAEYEKLYGVNGTYGAKAPAPPKTNQPGEGSVSLGTPTLLNRYKAAIAARKGTGA